ncbi:MAG: putative porin [Bacteroidia bacterium]|nr:putative porin [Bacteroidia bacterium]
MLSFLGDTSGGLPPVYQPAYLPWYDPLDTMASFAHRLTYFKPYALWVKGIPQYEELESAPSPASQEVYLLRHVPILWTEKPYTRIRFDQSSRRTQLLSLSHGQTFRRRGGLSLVYKRRTREGEYVGQTSDHYSAGGAIYALLRPHLWLRAEGVWNQLQDQINGGVLFDTSASPWDAFQKERQPVRLMSLRWRRWYRYVRSEVGFRISHRFFLTATGEVGENRLLCSSPPALQVGSPFVQETLAFQSNLQQTWHKGTLTLRWDSWQMEMRFQRLTGAGSPLFRSWNLLSLETQSHIQLSFLTTYAYYRMWLTPEAPPPAFGLWAEGYFRSYRIGAAYHSRNLPWLTYRSALVQQVPPNERFSRLWVKYTFPSRDTTILPLQITGWGTLYERPWLWESTPHSGSSLLLYGITCEGGLSWPNIGIISGLTLQKIYSTAGSSPWASILPLLSGWVQIFWQGQLPGRPPVYQVGVRLSGFSSFRLLAYEPHLGLYYLPPTPFPPQPAYMWVDPYLSIHIRRVMVYLRIERATENLIDKGYYLTAWYPMPGRAFAFGVQWDIYN